MQRKDSNYHRILRVSSLVCALALLFESGLLVESTANLSHNTHLYLANAVGMSAGVAPTELNQYTAELTKREFELDAREAELTQREIEVKLVTENGAPAENATATYLLASVLFILLVLILLNYALDYIRLKEQEKVQPV